MIRYIKLGWFWRVAILRAFIYMIIVGGTNFLTLTDQFSTQGWMELGGFEQSRYIGFSIIAALTTLIAFLDKTMSTLDHGAAESMGIQDAVNEKPGPQENAK